MQRVRMPWWSRDTRARVGLALLAGMIVLAALAPALSPVGPDVQRDVVQTRFLAPGSTDLHSVFHLLGTDRLGRDVWARLIHGARVSMTVGLLGMLVSLTIGIAVGAAAAAGSRGTATLLLGLTDFALGVPRVVLLLLLASLWNPSATLVVVVLGVTGWMPVARLVYAETRSLLARPFVEAVTALGAGKLRVLLRHALPNGIAPVVALATLGVGNAITLEAGLSFLGLGVQPPAASWGTMIASGRDTVVNAPWVGLAPGIALVLVVVGCTLVADSVRGEG